jgi:cobalt transporter subunit CbtB
MSEKSTMTTVHSIEASIASRAIQIVMAAALGLLVIAGAGFVQISAAHNAAHDYRHSMGFPCH